MRAYFDSGFLFKLYWHEANTPAAQAIVLRYQPPILLSRFNEVEILHVARRKTRLLGATGQPLLSPIQFQAGMRLFEQDLANGILTRLEVDYDEVFEAADLQFADPRRGRGSRSGLAGKRGARHARTFPVACRCRRQ